MVYTYAMIANKAQFCAIVGWTAREFDGYLPLGLPAKKKSSSRAETWQVDTVAAIAWLVNKATREVVGDPAPEDQPGALDVNQQRARLLAAQADVAEQQAAQMRGRLVDADEIRGALAMQDAI